MKNKEKPLVCYQDIIFVSYPVICDFLVYFVLEVDTVKILLDTGPVELLIHEISTNYSVRWQLSKVVVSN
jgi:hypothetical protein